jgi:hypothetical protein
MSTDSGDLQIGTESEASAGRGRLSAVTALSRRPNWAFAAACASAGALAVPIDALATPVAALVAGLAGLLGLRVWHWSRLPSAMTDRASRRFVPVIPVASWTGTGLVVGLVVLGAIRLAIEPVLPAAGARIAAAAELPLWRRGLIVYSAAVGEEIVFRLWLLSLISGLIGRLLRGPGLAPSRGAVWIANALSAIAFAAAHLPAWSAAGPLSVPVALAVLGLNAVGGVVFGCLFVRHGILAAMWAHAGADCALQLVGPLTR